jgi:hypothetical protein
MSLSRARFALVLLNLALASPRLAAQGSPPPPPNAASPGVIGAKPADSAAGPLIQFDHKEYNWGRVEAGEFVKHVFTVTNTGAQTLLITNVHPSCGCTTAGTWTREIPPGQTGTIPIQFNSAHYSGSAPITKTIDVYSNAKDHPRETLFLRGLVRKSIEITPPTPILNIVADATNSVSTIVRLTCQTNPAIELSDPVSSSKSVTAELETVTPGKEYKLTVTALPPFSVGSTSVAINLTTTLSNTPSFPVSVILAVQPEIQVSPPQLRLGMLPNVWTTNHSIFIRGNGATSLTLSDPVCSDPRIHAQVNPIGVPGMYNLWVAFPPNYQIEPGQKVEISVKSNNPRNPIVTVPLWQGPRGTYSGLPGKGPPLNPASAAHP